MNRSSIAIPATFRSRLLAFLRVLGALAMLWPTLSPAADPNPDPDPAWWPRLMQGEILLQNTNNAEGVPGLRALFTVATERERFWHALIDYGEFGNAFPDVKLLEVLQQDDAGAEIRMSVSQFLMNFSFTLHRRYERPGRRLSWTRTAGDFRHVSGSWEIRDTADPRRLLVVYESYVDAGSLIPTSLTRRLSVGQTESMIEHLRHWVEDQQPARERAR